MYSNTTQDQQPTHHGVCESEEHLSASVGAGKSEVAHLLRQIDLEYTSAQQALSGLSSGTARHDFINARMQQVAVYHEHLTTQVGEEEATRLIYDHYVNHIG